MFSDEEIKESSLTRPGDEIISIREVCLRDKFDKNGGGSSLLLSSNRNELDVPRLYRDNFFPDTLDQSQARFAWTEEDGNIASLVSEPGFGTTGQTSFGKDLDATFKTEMKIEQVDEEDLIINDNEAESSSSNVKNSEKAFNNNSVESTLVSSSSNNDRPKRQGACKVDKADPRSRLHFVKYVKRQGRTFKLWECGICGREFQHQYTLMRHLPTHTDERNFHCDVCGKSFRQLSTLSQHRAIHSAERPYACEVCNKTFNRVSTLISHRKTHSNEKPYRCHWCPKGFHQKGNLRNHLFTHTNERPYRCNICNTGFNQQSNLVCHKIKAHPEEAPKPSRWRNTPRNLSKRSAEPQTDSIRTPKEQQCEVSSSVGPYIPSSIDSPDWSKSWEQVNIWNNDNSNFGSNAISNGVIVDQIKTYHMNVALATHQTPFALLKPDNGTPVLVKVVDTKLPGGKQMLDPATAEDLRVGGKILMKHEDQATNVVRETTGGVQIRVPVVATVVPKIKRGGRLHLSVEEPHHAYHTALSDDVVGGDVKPCIEHLHRSCVETMRPSDSLKDNTPSCSSSFVLPPPAPSPPLDLISLDLFEPMECIPMGPQITPVSNIDHHQHSADSDTFGKFERANQEVASAPDLITIASTFGNEKRDLNLIRFNF